MPETDDMNSEDVDATTTLEFPDSPPRRAAAAVRKARRHASFIWENSAGNFFLGARPRERDKTDIFLCVPTLRVGKNESRRPEVLF